MEKKICYNLWKFLGSLLALMLLPNILVAQPVTVTIPDTSGMSGDTITIPINVSDVTGLGIIAADVTLTFDADILTALDASLGSVVPSGWLIYSYPTDGQIIIAMAGANPLSGSGSLVTIAFVVDSMAPPGDTTTIHFANLQFNEGGIPADLYDGIFTVSLIPPELISPPNGSFTNNNTPTFDWSDASGATKYWLQVDDDSTFASPAINDSTLISSTYTPTTPLADAVYYWRVRAGNEFVWSDWTYSWILTVDITPPSVPNLISPPDGSATNDSTPTFIWNASTDNLSDVEHYILKYADNPDFSGADSIDTPDTAYTPTNSLADTIHYWKVKAVDRAMNASNWSATWNFEVDTQAPNTPSLLSPTGGGWLNSTLVTFEWTMVTFFGKASEVRYILEVDTVASFTAPIVDTTPVPYDTLILNENFYYWRVKAYDLAGNQGNFSNLDSFGVDITAPSIPNLLSPPDGYTTNDSTPTFIWNASTDNLSGVDYYTLQYASDSLFTSGVVTVNNIADTLYIVPNTLALSDSTYYWRVKAIDEANNSSGYQEHPFSFTVKTVCDISGNVNYYSNSNPVESTVVLLSGDALDTAYTNTSGYYQFVDLQAGLNYTVTPNKINANKEPAISAYDAALVLRHVVGLDTLDPYQQMAADVSANATISSFDAALILQYAVCLIDYFPIRDSTGSDWAFDPNSRSYEPLNLDQTDQDYLAILYGDVSGNWTGGSTILMGSGFDENEVDDVVGLPYEATQPVIVTIPDTSGIPGDTVIISINVSDVTGLGIISADITLTFDADILTAMEASLGNVAPGGWFIQSNPTPGQIVIGMAGANPLSGSGSLVTIPFVVDSMAPPGDTTTIHFANLQFNEGGVPADLYDGIFTVSLIPPELISPPNGSFTNDDTPTFDWSDVANATMYWLQVAGDSNFSSPVIDDSTLIESTYTPSIPLTEDLYYWHVRAGNEFVWSAWTAVWTFTLDTASPSIPDLIAPDSSIATNDPTPTFVWRASTDNLSGVDHYTLEYADNPGFSGAASIQVTDTTYTTDPLPDTTYYWRVKAIDRAANESDWSATWNFEIDTEIPNTPNLISPIDGVWLNNPSIPFEWTQVTFSGKASEVRYVIQVDTSISFPTPIVDTTDVPYDTLTLDEDFYYWRVKAYDLAGNQGDFSNPDSFGVDITAPDPFDLISPEDSTWLNILRPTFEWYASTDLGSGIRNYQIYTDEVLRDSTVDTLWTANYDLPEGSHTWYIIAYDNASNYRVSEIWTLGIDTTSPEFSETTIWPDTSFQGPYPVSSIITDDLSGVDAVFLCCSFDSISWDTIPMQWAPPDTYKAEIPEAPGVNTTIWYYLYARDFAANVGYDPLGAPDDSLYSFTGWWVGIAEQDTPIPTVFALSQNQPNPFCQLTVIRYQLPDIRQETKDRKSKNQRSHVSYTSRVAGLEFLVSLKIYNLSGQLVRTLVDKKQSPGFYTVQWDGRNENGERVPAGVYFYRIVIQPVHTDPSLIGEIGSFKSIKKMILLQ